MPPELPLDWEAIRRAFDGDGPPLRLILRPDQPESALFAALEDLARAVAEAAGGGAVIERGDAAGVPARPALTLAVAERAPIHYLALPEEREAAPFTEAVVALAQLGRSSGPEPTAPWAKRLRGLTEPAELYVFAAPSCPHCPLAVAVANRIALASPQVTTSIVDVQRYDDLAKRLKVDSVPRTVVDGGLSLTGVVKADELVDLLLSRGSAEYAERSFGSLIETGRLDDATAQLRTDHGPRCLVSAWRQSSTSSRMALLLTVEDVLEEDPAALDAVVHDLLPLLAADDAALQGDTADLLGRIGHADATAAIEALLDHDNPDVAEIAEEALEQIQERSDG